MMYKYRWLLATLGLVTALAVAVPASAATNNNNGSGGMVGWFNSIFHRGVQNGTNKPMPGNFIFGTVAGISGDTLTVTSQPRPMPVNSSTTPAPAPTTYTVDATNATVTKNNAASTVSAIAVGDTVAIQGTISGTNVTATTIRDGLMMMRGGPGAGRGRGVFGTVATINGNTLTVTSKMGGPNSTSTTTTTYTVDATNAKVTKDNAASTISAIAVGDTVAIQGTISGTNITATMIRDGVMTPGQPTNPLIQGNGEPVIAGTISNISGNTLTVTNKSNVTYTVDVTNAKVTKGNAASTVSAIVVGDNVVIQGTVNGTSITAASVIDSGTTPTKTGMTGNSSNPHPGIFGSIGSFFKRIFGF
jgi:hypothetical protein